MRPISPRHLITGRLLTRQPEGKGLRGEDRGKGKVEGRATPLLQHQAHFNPALCQLAYGGELSATYQLQYGVAKYNKTFVVQLCKDKSQKLILV